MTEGLATGYDMRDGQQMVRFPLQRRAFDAEHGFPWSSCAPFVENTRGVLIHRPRSGVTFNCHKTPHIGIKFWCGMQISTSKKNITLLYVPPEGEILCARCEEFAVENGLPPADELAGRHVHKGRTKAVVTCCNIESKP